MDVKRMMDNQICFPRDRVLLLKKALLRAVQRLHKKLDKQSVELGETEKASWYRQIGDSLLARPEKTHRGAITAMVVNIHTQKEESVSLNPKFDQKGNAELFYKKARKAERGGQINAQKVAETRERIEAGEQALRSCEDLFSDRSEENAAGMDDLCRRMEKLLKEYAPNELPSVVSGPRQIENPIPYRRYMVDEWHVYIGKNDAQNDEMTTRFAKLQDLWLHVAGHAGSHVVIRRTDKTVQVPREVIEKAASLAVWFSKAKHTSYAEVHYTEARFVRKRRHSPPGEVVLERYKTIRVSPRSPHDLFPSHYDGATEIGT
jgi:predicted ribosome quality control (RQC) complex YloA/Tae2 family protein